MKWNDTTSYSQREIIRIPRVLEIKVGSLVVIVHRHIDHESDIWVLTCAPWFNKTPLKHKELEAAKAEALVSVSVKIVAIKAALDKLL